MSTLKKDVSIKKPAPPPHSSSYYLEVMKDPELRDDSLPQPFRMLDKILNGIIDSALEQVSSDPKLRRRSRRSFRPGDTCTDIINPSLKLELTSSTCCCSTPDGSRLFVGDETGNLHVVDSFSGHSLGFLAFAHNHAVGTTFELESENIYDSTKKGTTDLSSCLSEPPSLQSIASLPLGATPDTGRHLVIVCTRAQMKIFHLRILSGCQGELVGGISLHPELGSQKSNDDDVSKYVIKSVSISPDGMFAVVYFEWPGGGQCQVFALPVVEAPPDDNEPTAVVLPKRTYKIPMPNETESIREERKKESISKNQLTMPDCSPKTIKQCLVLSGPPSGASFVGEASAALAKSRAIPSRMSTVDKPASTVPEPIESETVPVTTSSATTSKKDQPRLSARGKGKGRKGTTKRTEKKSEAEKADKKSHDLAHDKLDANVNASGETASEVGSTDLQASTTARTSQVTPPEVHFLMAPLSPLQQVYYRRTDAFNEVLWKQQVNVAATAGLGGPLATPLLVVCSLMVFWPGYNAFARYSLPTNLAPKPEDEEDDVSAKPERVWTVSRAVSCSALDHSSVLLAIGFADGSIQLWDTSTGSMISELRAGHRGPVTALSILSLPTPVGLTRSDEAKKILRRYPALAGVDRIVSGGCDGEVRLFDAVTCEIISVFSPPSEAEELVVSPADLQSMLCTEYHCGTAIIEQMSKPEPGFYWLSSISSSPWTTLSFFAVPALEMVISKTISGLVIYGVGPGSVIRAPQLMTLPNDHSEGGSLWYIPPAVSPLVCVGAGGMGLLCAIAQEFIVADAKQKHTEISSSSGSNHPSEDVCLQTNQTGLFLFHLQDVFGGAGRGTVPELNLGNDAMMRMFSSVKNPSNRSKPRDSTSGATGARPLSGASNPRKTTVRSNRTARTATQPTALRKEEITDQFEELGTTASFRDASWHISAQLRYEQMTREQRSRRIDRREKELRNEERGKMGLIAEPATARVGSARSEKRTARR